MGIEPMILFHQGKEHGLQDTVDLIAPNSFIWLPDAGTNDVEQCKALMEHGCKVLITDHHDAEVKNPYAIIYNSQNEKVQNHNACGTLVTHKFIKYIYPDFPVEYESLVGLATIADMMDLTQEENRYYVYKLLTDVYKHPFLQDMIDTFIGRTDNKFTIRDLSFNVIPKLNAVQRSDNQQLKADLFDTFVNYTASKSEQLIKELSTIHRKQSNDVKKIAAKIENNMIEENNLIIGFNESSPYTGLFANRLLGTYNKPVFIVSKSGEDYKGSMRSTIPIKSILNESGLINWCQGHEQAAGISFPVKNYNQIVELFDTLDILPEFNVVKSFTVSEIKRAKKSLFTEFFEHQEMYGQGLERPLVHVRKIKIKGSNIQTLGSYGTTIKFKLGDVSFVKHFVSKDQRAKWFVGENKDLEIDLIGFPMMNEYMGNQNKQIEIDRMEVVEVKKSKTTVEDLW